MNLIHLSPERKKEKEKHCHYQVIQPSVFLFTPHFHAETEATNPAESKRGKTGNHNGSLRVFRHSSTTILRNNAVYYVPV